MQRLLSMKVKQISGESRNFFLGVQQNNQTSSGESGDGSLDMIYCRKRFFWRIQKNGFVSRAMWMTYIGFLVTQQCWVHRIRVLPCVCWCFLGTYCTTISGSLDVCFVYLLPLLGLMTCSISFTGKKEMNWRDFPSVKLSPNFARQNFKFSIVVWNLFAEFRNIESHIR